MKSYTMKAKMEEMGVTGSHSRPRVSNDNPYSESLFKTLKYSTKWPPKGFKDIEAVRAWVSGFARWYNEEHCHSAIRFVTPSQRHQSLDIGLLQRRHEVYLKARAANPLRWSGAIRNWSHIKEVYLNPEKQNADVLAEDIAA